MKSTEVLLDKKMFAIFAVSIFLISAVSVPVMAHTEDDPFVTDLIAGGGNEASEMDVGEVSVWNDGETLYVTYTIITEDADDIYLLETHLHVTSEVEDNYPVGIPQTKKNNPIPGHFYYSTEHDIDDEVKTFTYEINLEENDLEEDEVVYIAAHAEIGWWETVIDPETGDEIEVLVEETAWGEGEGFLGKNWAMYFIYTVQAPGEPGEQEPEPGEPQEPGEPGEPQEPEEQETEIEQSP